MLHLLFRGALSGNDFLYAKGKYVQRGRSRASASESESEKWQCKCEEGLWLFDCAVGAIHVRMKERRCEGHKNDSTTKLKSDLFYFGQKLHSPVMHLSSI